MWLHAGERLEPSFVGVVRPAVNKHYNSYIRSDQYQWEILSLLCTFIFHYIFVIWPVFPTLLIWPFHYRRLSSHMSSQQHDYFICHLTCHSLNTIPSMYFFFSFVIWPVIIPRFLPCPLVLWPVFPAALVLALPSSLPGPGQTLISDAEDTTAIVGAARRTIWPRSLAPCRKEELGMVLNTPHPLYPVYSFLK